MAEVKLERVRKTYGSGKKKVEAVKGVDLRCDDGELLVFLGPSGCGKTSTMRMIAGLETITSGAVSIGGRRVNDVPAGERNVALAFENYALYPPMTVGENITFPLRARKLDREAIAKRLAAVASLLGLEDVLDRSPARLGGGQQQMVSLARCLVRDASVYLMDEPLSHLDSDRRSRIRVQLKALHRETKSTIIYVTHDQQEALALADRIAVMNDGRLQQLDTPDRVYSQPKTLFVAGFIGEPPMNFVAGRFAGGAGPLRFESRDGSLVIPVAPGTLARPGAAADGKDAVLGIRPEDISPASRPPGDSFGSRVEVYESLGEEAILEVRCGENVLVTLSKPRLPLGAGQRLDISVNPRKAAFFDPRTEERL